MKWLFIFLLFSSIGSEARMRVAALVKVPVVDVSGQSLRTCGKNMDFCYNSFPLAPDKGSSACLRLHQLLFNQKVIIVKELHNGEVQVEVPGLLYTDGFHRSRNDCWMLKKNLILLHEIDKSLQDAIPIPLSDMSSSSREGESVLTLTEPWSESKTTYSVGTRFVRCPERDTESAFGVSYIDTDTNVLRHELIQKRKALISSTRTFERARRIFMSILRGWAHQSKEPAGRIVPYVFGGCSLTAPVESKGFSRVKGIQCGQRATYWQRQGHMSTPKSGFDCSSMIFCAAQIAGLPYFYKNTRALVTHLQPLKPGEALEEGDLIWYVGHVLVISDIKKQLVIESSGYEWGFGQVHELPLGKVFSTIKTCDQLIHAHFAKQFTYRLNKEGKSRRSVYRIKILKLRSVLSVNEYTRSSF